MSKLLFIPGMMCDERLFAHQIAALAEQKEIVCAALDGPPSITGLAAELLAAHPGLLCIAGLSMGGIVAMEMVKQAPDRVERLALLDSNHHADLASRFDIRNRQIADVRAGRLAEVVDTDLMPTYFAKASEGDLAIRQLVRNMAAALGPAIFEHQSIALRDRPDQSQALQGYDGPTLLLCGAEDRLCPPSGHREMAMLLRDHDLEIVEHAGHLPTIERPDIVTGALRRWLSRPRSKSS